MSQLASSDGQARFLHLKSVSVEDERHEAKFTVILKHASGFEELFKSDVKLKQANWRCNTYVQASTQLELAVHVPRFLCLTRRVAKFNPKLDSSDAAKSQKFIDERYGISMDISFGECITGLEVAHRRFDQAMSDLGNHEHIMRKLEIGIPYLKVLMHLGTGLSELTPVSKAVVSIVSEMFKRVEEIPENYREFCTLIMDTLSLLPTTDEALKNFKSVDVQRVLHDFVKIVNEASQELIAFYTRPKRNFWVNSLVSSKKDDIKKLQEEIRQGVTHMGLAFQNEIQSGVLNVLENIMELRLQNISDDDRKHLDKLMPPDNSTFDRDYCCLSGTRTSTLEKLELWARDCNSSSRLYWVYGVAGCGKSSVASSIARRLDVGKVLAGSFFCKRDVPERKDPVRLIWSLARSIANASKHFGSVLLEVLKMHDTFDDKRLKSQFTKLLEQPLLRVKCSTVPVPLILVVDALDECDDNGGVSACLATMVQRAPWLRIIVTCRYIRDVNVEFSKLSELKEEADLFQEDAHVDILAYLRHQFSSNGVLFALQSVVKEDQIQALAARAHGLFIWIETVVKYISSPRFGKYELIKDLLASEKAGNAEKGLDALYRHVLDTVAGNAPDGKLAVRLVVGILFSSSRRMPLSASTLYSFMPPHLPLQLSELKILLEDLSPVLIQGASCEPVRVYHPSFLDFIENETRSGEYWTDDSELEAIMAKACFRIMECGSRCDESQQKVSNEGLRFNICRLESSYLANRKVKDLKERISANISPELQYSSMFWYDHLEKSNLDTEIRDMMNGLLGTSRTLYWLEAMGLMGKLSSARDILSRLLEEDMLVLDDGEMPNVISELNLFVEALYDGIKQSAPHIYTTAMVWVPSGSILGKRWSPQFPRPQIVSRHIVNWPSDRQPGSMGGSLFSTWSKRLYSQLLKQPMSPLRQVAYSTDGMRIVSDAHNYTLRIHDARSGVPVGEPLKGHTKAIWCVVYSPDGTRIVSGSGDGTLRMWDGKSGSPVGEPLKGHTNSVTCVAYSPDGRHIISGSRDRTLRMWDGESGAPVGQPLNGHTDWVECVVYSLDGTRIISGSGDGTLRMWDGKSGAPIGKPLKGHTDWVTCVAYSPDGTRIVSGSDGGTLRMWDGESGAPVGEPLRGHTEAVWCVAYSPDGTRVASGSGDCTLRMWDGQSGAPIGKPLKGHTGLVTCVLYSPDGTRIISASEDGTLRMWDAQSGVPVTDSPWGESRWDADRQCFVSTSEMATPGAAERPPAHPPVPLCVPHDGWIRTLSGNRLLWIPEEYRDDIYDMACMPENADGHLLGIDLKNLCHGNNWTKIYRE